MEEKEEPIFHNSSNDLLNRVDTVKSEVMIELENKDTSENADDHRTSRSDTQSSFNKALLDKVRKEEQENNLRKIIKERERIISQMHSITGKDYIVFFVIMASTGLNFNYLYLPIVFLCII